MGNYLQVPDVKKIETLLELGWGYRRIARELGIHRTTVARYGREGRSKPTNPIAGLEIELTTPGLTSMAHLHHDFIKARVEKGLSGPGRTWSTSVATPPAT